MFLVLWRARPCFWFFTPHTRIGTGRNNTSLCCGVEGLPTDSNTKFTNIRRLGTVMTDRPTDMTKLIGAFRYSCERAYKPMSLPSMFHICLSWSSRNSMICNTSTYRSNLTFKGPFIVIYSYNKDALFLNFILVKNSVPSRTRYQTVNITCMTNTNCCEYSIKTPDDGQ